MSSEEQPAPKTKKSSYETWLDELKSVEITEDEANEILDEYLSKGYWEKEYKLFNGRYVVTLRTRDAAHNQRVANTLDSLRTSDPAVYSQNIFRLNLAGSLAKTKDLEFPYIKFNGKNYKELEDDFTKKLSYIDNSLGDLLVTQLFEVLRHFDKLTTAVFSNGASSAFLALHQE